MPEQPRIGELFAGRYRIESLLGEGGMGAVYRAHDERVGDAVALKTLLASFGRMDEALERFRREVRLARRITHPNVARIHDLGEHDGIHFLTMEYVRGRDLSHLLDEEGPLVPARAASLVLPVARALSAIHAAGVVHRDVKPANVLVEEGGRIVLTDFGIARSDDRTAAFRTAGPIGTPLYMAPEQIAGRNVDARTDLYALGLVLYELLTGDVPFLRDTPIATAVARLQEPPPDPRAHAPLPDALAALVLRCLAREPDTRPGSADELAAALEPFATGTPPAPLAVMATAPLATAPLPADDTVSPGDRALAVLPFRYRGPAEHAYLGDSLTDELIDLLSTTRGLRVLASGATQRYREERDPRTLGRELGVDSLVDGTVQAAGNRVRVTARLCEVRTGTQLWSDRFEGSLEDVFTLQDLLGRRVAESLRVGLSTATHRGNAPAEAVESYLRARNKMRARVGDTSLAGAGGVLELLDRCLEAAPDFAPALAAHAIASLRAWFVPGAQSRHWEAIARQSVARAIERGGDLAEAQLAAAILAVQDGRYPEAARHLERALEIAPTYANAHEYLGRLQCEAGKAKEGLRRLRLALDLDPTLAFAHQDIARIERLHGDLEVSQREQERFEDAVGASNPAALANRIRFACWEGDMASVERLAGEAERGGLGEAPRLLAFYGRIVHGAVPADEATASFETVIAAIANPRFRSIAFQLASEALSTVGATDAAFGYLKRGADTVLIDLEWLDRCPALAALRSDPRFAGARAQVLERASGIWGL